MMRVSLPLARGIVLTAVLLSAGGRLSDPPPSKLAGAIALVRAQDFTPIFDVAGRRIDGYFDPRKGEQFLEEVFSLSGKWKAVTRSRKSYEHYVRKVFEDKIFTNAEFDRILDQIRQDYAYGITAAENRLLVALYEDIRPVRPRLTLERFRAEYAELAGAIAPEVVRDLGMNLISFAGSDAAAVLLVSALSSAGILGTSAAAGAVTGPATFGISLVVGIIAGIALDAVVGDAYEDAARGEVRQHLNTLRNRVIDDVHAALVKAILAYRTVQERCVRELYEGGPHEHVARRP